MELLGLLGSLVLLERLVLPGLRDPLDLQDLPGLLGLLGLLAQQGLPVIPVLLGPLAL